MSRPSIIRPDRMPFLPAVGAVAMAWVALTPSLLPRPGVFQGLLCGLGALIGYALGAFLGWILRGSGLSLAGRVRTWAWRVFTVVAVVGTVTMLITHLRWQRDLRTLLGTEQIAYGYLTRLVVVGVLVFVLVLVISRTLRAIGRGTRRQVARVLPPRIAMAVAAVVVAAGSWAFVNQVIAGRVVERLDATFVAINNEFVTELPAPTSPHLSAGPGSLTSWEDLGRQGRLFIANAPSAQKISDFTGKPALQPVRAYLGVGVDGTIDLRAEAELAVDELERTGGLERAVVNVATGTGRGWVNENQAQALEYMWGGDTATVSMQYSYLPSWMSFLVDGQRAQDAGRLLFEAVYARIQELPEDERPLLVVSGESLGSFGGEAAFSGAQDMVHRTDGVLFVGPPDSNRLWSRFVGDRDAGTREVAPIYDRGYQVRFSPDGIEWPGSGTWEQPRIGYVQHANDPITWWSWALAFNRPDWLTEERGDGVLPQTRWIPIITMLQVGADQFVANDVPAGQGHQFGQAPVYAWAEILPPDGWTRADSDRLARVIKDRTRDIETPEGAATED